jgi:hypothetical protein
MLTNSIYKNHKILPTYSVSNYDMFTELVDNLLEAIVAKTSKSSKTYKVNL